MISPNVDVAATQAQRAPAAPRDSAGDRDRGQLFKRVLDEQSGQTPLPADSASSAPADLLAKDGEILDAPAADSAAPGTASATGWQEMLAQVLMAAQAPAATAAQATATPAAPAPAAPTAQAPAAPTAQALAAPAAQAPAAPAAEAPVAPSPGTQNLRRNAGQVAAAHSDSLVGKQGSADSEPAISEADPRIGAEPAPGKQSTAHAKEGHARAASANLKFKGIEEAAGVGVHTIASATHYPVVGDPVRQIVSEVSREVTASAASSAAEPADAAGAQPTKTLHVQLEPESLGTVTVRMRLSGARLSIQLEVQRPETLDMITRQQDVLHHSLGSEQCRVESLTIRAAAAADSPAASQGASQDNNQNTPAQQQDSSAYAGDRSRGQRERQNLSKGTQNEEVVRTGDRDSSARGLYL